MKKDIQPISNKLPIKDPVNKIPIYKQPWLTWKVEFSKELTSTEISLEQPNIEVFLDEYLAGKVKGKHTFTYVWKAPVKFLKASVKNLKTAEAVSGIPLKPAPVYTLNVYINPYIIGLNVSVPDAPGSIIKLSSGRYTRGIPTGSTKNTVRLTKPPI